MAVSAKDSKLLEQKDLISQLNTTIAAQTELIQSLKKDHEADREQIQNLLAQVDYLTKKLFGTSSEKMKDVEGQLNLFDKADVDLKAPVIKVSEHTRKKNVLLRIFLKVRFQKGSRFETAVKYAQNRKDMLMTYLLEHRPSEDMLDVQLEALTPWSKEVQNVCKN